MVTRRTLTVSRFIPRASQAIQQQQPPQGCVPAPSAHPPPPPPSKQQHKRQRVADLSTTSLGEAQVQTSHQLSRGITIREPPTQVGTNVALSSRPAQLWQPTFELDGIPLSASASVRAWEKCEGGRVAQSLVHDLLLPEDVSAFADGTDESMGRRLQWHTIAVISLPLHTYLFFIYAHSYYYRIHCSFKLPCVNNVIFNRPLS